MPDYNREVSRGSRKSESGKFRDGHCINNKRITKSKLYLIVTTFIIICGIVIGLIFSLEGRSLNQVNTASMLNPTPPSFAPSVQEQPLLLCKESQIFDGESLGYSLGMNDNLLVTSNNSSIYTYELGGSNVPIGQTFDGNVVSIANTNRIVVQRDDFIAMYDYAGKDWEDAGKILLKSAYSTAISISGDGFTILISVILDNNFLQSQAYRREGGFWKEYGRAIKKRNKGVDIITNTLNHDGKYCSFGSNSESFSYKLSSNEYWGELNGAFEYVHGPFVSMSNDGSTLVAGGQGTIAVQSINKSFLGRAVLVANYQYSTETKADDLLLAVSDDGNRFVYLAVDEKKVNIFDLQGKNWAKTAELPFTNLTVKALSFSKNGKLAVGLPELGKVKVYKFTFQ